MGLPALAAASARSLAEGSRRATARICYVAASEEFVDGQDLEARVLLVRKVLWSVDAGG